MGMTSLRPRRLLAVVVAAIVGLGACSTAGDESADGRLTIVATTTILGDVVTNIVGEGAEVEVVMPRGADPHDFQPSAAQVATINSADLVVANGLGLELGLEDVLAAAVSDGVRVLEIGPALDPLPLAEGELGDEGHDDEHGSLDPHIWFDPLRMAQGARLIGDELAMIDEGIDWQARADEYAASLADLDRELVEMFDSIDRRRRSLVTSHEALGYFAARYGFTIIGTIVPGGSTLGDPSSEALAELVAAMEAHQVSAIFTDSTQSSALAEAIAEELGVPVAVVSLYTGSLGDPGSGADTLVGMLRTNAERIASALNA